MPMQLLCALAAASLPHRISGEHLCQVEALTQAGLLVATVHREGSNLLEGYAILHDVTTMGLMYADAFARLLSAGAFESELSDGDALPNSTAMTLRTPP